jgi:signal transduction histidine kinase
MEKSRPQDDLELATSIAHELQNSLQIIRSLAFVGGDSANAETFKKIERQAELAQSIVSDVLALGECPLATESLSLGPLVLSAHERSQRGALQLAGNAYAKVHAGLFIRICSILFENAHNAFSQQLVLRVHLEETDAHVCMRVTDNGPGIAFEDRERIFSRGVSGRGSTGLGLSLARSIAEAHHGTLSLANAPSGTSASFEFTLPKR